MGSRQESEVRSQKNGTRMVFEGAETDSADERRYGLIAELYQQLKKNFDDRRDYWTAGDFHWGEMEMKRLSSQYRNPLVRWLHRNLGLTAFYKYASEYGESYGRPAVWLGIILLLFTALFPWAGFQTGNGEVSYERFVELVANGNSAWVEGLGLIGHSLLAAVSVMALQRDVIQTLSYPWGRALALTELLLRAR